MHKLIKLYRNKAYKIKNYNNLIENLTEFIQTLENPEKKCLTFRNLL